MYFLHCFFNLVFSGACNMILNMDDVLRVISRYCPNIKNVVLWKLYSLTPRGMRELAKWRNLKKLDVGWW